MPGGFGYGLAFMTGIAGAFHCLGMCGTFAGGYFIGHGWKHKLTPHIAYHSVRIFTYVLLGIGGALAGRVLAQAGIVGKAQGILMIVAGLIIIVTGLWLGGFLPWRQAKSCHKQCNAVHFQDWRKGKYMPLLAGLMNGLVPCSLVFSVAIKTLVTDNVLEAGLIMLFFGLGTLPMMLLVTASGALAGDKIKGVFIPLTGLLVILMGSWTLYEGIVFYDIMRGLAN
jgi:sulfite exporter TauE/SafE